MLSMATLHVEQVRDVSVGVGLVGGPVELEVDHVQSRLLRLNRELGLESEAEAVGGGLDELVADLLRVRAGLEKVRRHGGLATGELHDHLPPGLEGDRVVEDLLDLLEGQLVHVPHLVGVHEAGVAHHVAAVGEVHGEDRAPAVADGGGPVAVHILVAEGPVVAPREPALDDLVELHVDRADVVEGPVLGAGLGDPQLVALLVEGGPDLAQVAAHQLLELPLAAQYLLAGLDDAPGTQGVGLTRVAQRRARSLVRLRQRSRGPLGLDRSSLGHTGVDGLEGPPGQVADLLQRRVHRLSPRRSRLERRGADQCTVSVSGPALPVPVVVS